MRAARDMAGAEGYRRDIRRNRADWTAAGHDTRPMLPVMAVLVTAIHAVPHAAAPSRTGASRPGRSWPCSSMVPSPRHGVDGRDKPGHDECDDAAAAEAGLMGTGPAMTGWGLGPQADSLPAGLPFRFGGQERRRLRIAARPSMATPSKASDAGSGTAAVLTWAPLTWPPVDVSPPAGSVP